MPSLDEINSLSVDDALEGFYKCCGSSNWAQTMVKSRPFLSVNHMLSRSDDIWSRLEEHDFKEAFSHHPRIGENIEVLRKKFSNTVSWATEEQRGVAGASEDTLQELKVCNRDYESKFRYVFIICATGKSADEMLKAIQDRIPNDPDKEIIIAAKEQNKITRLRLEKWVNS